MEATSVVTTASAHVTDQQHVRLKPLSGVGIFTGCGQTHKRVPLQPSFGMSRIPPPGSVNYGSLHLL